VAEAAFSMPKPPIVRTLLFYPEEMAERGRLGGQRTHERHDSNAIAAKARAGFDARFEGTADPVAARSEYFRRLGQMSAAARRAREEVA
jgi:hypothetical protein